MANDEQRLILVTGATGHQGGAVARHLLRDGELRVRALTRDPAKPTARALGEQGAEVVKGDLDDRATVEAAIDGASGVFSVQNFWEAGFDREVEQGVRLADVALAAGVEHFIYSSVGSADRETGLSHFESKWRIESHIRSIDLPYTIFRPVWFMSNFENPAFTESIRAGALPMPLSPDRSFQQIRPDDIGAFVALAFGDPDGWLGRELDLAGDERSMSDVAAAFGRVLGRPVEYNQVPWDAYREAAGKEYYEMMRWFEDVGYDADPAALRGIYPELSAFDRYLREEWREKVEA